jgi:hypothetical protein
MKTYSLTFRVCAQYIECAYPPQSLRPIGMALEARRLPNGWSARLAGVFGSLVSIDSGEDSVAVLTLPPSVKEFITRLDAGLPVSPFRFRLAFSL